jgi:signal transduction histidine kinase
MRERFFWRHRLYLRIYAAVLASIALVALLFGTMWGMNPDPMRVGHNLDTFAEFAAETLPPASATREEQQDALVRWHKRMRASLALYDTNDKPIAAAGRPLPPPDPAQTASGWLEGRPPVFALKLPDGRWLVGQRNRPPHRSPHVLMIALALTALLVGLAAYPVVRRLTRRLERLQTSVEALGAGQLSTRVPVEGSDEVARLAQSFNQSAERVEALVTAQKSLLANASHELRSPLARVRMAIELAGDGSSPEIREELKKNIAELDQLIDEILLASRLDAVSDVALHMESIDFAALAAEECARVGAELSAEPAQMEGDARLLRRMIRNLLENAKRHGEDSPIEVALRCLGKEIQLEVCDGGRGVPLEERERIFEPFYRIPGTRERDGSVGLGLSLVRQIARRHGGDAHCFGREGKGACFRVRLKSPFA